VPKILLNNPILWNADNVLFPIGGIIERISDVNIEPALHLLVRGDRLDGLACKEQAANPVAKDFRLVWFPFW
jgi:hypothetical protein